MLCPRLLLGGHIRSGTVKVSLRCPLHATPRTALDSHAPLLTSNSRSCRSTDNWVNDLSESEMNPQEADGVVDWCLVELRELYSESSCSTGRTSVEMIRVLCVQMPALCLLVQAASALTQCTDREFSNQVRQFVRCSDAWPEASGGPDASHVACHQVNRWKQRCMAVLGWCADAPTLLVAEQLLMNHWNSSVNQGAFVQCQDFFQDGPGSLRRKLHMEEDIFTAASWPHHSSRCRQRMMIVNLEPGNDCKSWEQLRKEARTLENRIDVKLVALSKFGTSLGQTLTGVHQRQADDQEPLLGNGHADGRQHLTELSMELDDYLTRLGQVHDCMSQYVASSASNLQTAAASPASLHHVLQRHKDILQDYRQEFIRTRANLQATLDRNELMSSVNRDASSSRDASGVSGSRSRMDLLLKENEHIRNSERLIDEQISMALESRDSLISQRHAFKAVQAKLNDLSSRFPAVNNLVQKINLRKKRDSLIIGAVIGVCSLFMLWYAFG